jgi:hypothetical protein
MRNSAWKEVGSLDELMPKYTQLRLFPPTGEEILLARVNELEQKLERQRKGQFGKIGRNEKRLRELEERFVWIEKAICNGETVQQNTCEILELVSQ